MPIKTKGLGKGLDSLIPDNKSMKSVTSEKTVESKEDAAAKSGVQVMKINEVEPNRDQPRKNFDEDALLELSDSIKQFGVLQPLLVRKRKDYYEIIAGERRWRAAKLAGVKEVPVIEKEYTDQEILEIGLIENIQRENLNPIEEAKGYKLLIEEYGLTQEDAARSVGRSRPAVTNAMRLLMLAPQVMEMVEKGELSAGHARAILTVSEPSKQLAAANEIIRKNYSVRKAEQLAAKIFRESQQTKEESSEINVDYAAEVSNELSKKLGRKVRLIEGKRNGKIEIEFYGADDREALIEKLLKL